MISTICVMLESLPSPEQGSSRDTYLWDLMKKKAKKEKSERSERSQDDIDEKKKRFEKSDNRRLSQRIKDNADEKSLLGQAKQAVKDYLAQ